jgi:hypothetical protein
MLNKVTQERLKERLHYDQATGKFTYIKNRKKAFIGKDAGFVDCKGYRIISLSWNEKYVASSLVWLYIYGKFPDGKIRYINDDKTDLRLCNLKDVDTKECQQDFRKATKKSSSGLLGVYWDNINQTWMSSITAQGKYRWLGRFKDKHDAHAAYLEAKKEMHPESKLAQS